MIARKLLAVLISALCAGAAQADLLILSNGDRLSGELDSMIDGELRFITEFEQELVLPWALVTQIATRQRVQLVLTDESLLTGRLRAVATAGSAMLDTAETTAVTMVELSRVQAIFPGAGSDTPARSAGRINFGASVTRGNTETESFHGDVELTRRSHRNRHTLGAEANYGRDAGVRSRNNAAGYARLDRFLDARRYLNTNLSLAHDEFRDLELRLSAGVGLGYQFLDSERHRLSSEAGINYVREAFVESTESRPAGRLAMDYEHSLDGDRLSLFSRNELLIGLAQRDDLLLRSRSGLQFPFMDRLQGTMQVNLDYNHLPPAGSRPTDLAYLFSLGLSW